MTGTFTRRRGITKLALLTVLATVAIGFAAISTIAASTAIASNNGADRAPSDAGNPGQVASSAELPTLTNDVGQPRGGAERQLSLGIALLALGLLGLILGVSARLTTDRGPRPRARRSAPHDVAQRAG